MKLHHNGGRMQWNVELSLRSPERTSKNSENTQLGAPRSKKGQSRKILLLPWGWYVYRRRKLARDTPEGLALEALGQELELELELPKAQELGLSKPKESKIPEPKKQNLVHEIMDSKVYMEMYSPLPGVEYLPTWRDPTTCEPEGESSGSLTLYSGSLTRHPALREMSGVEQLNSKAFSIDRFGPKGKLPATGHSLDDYSPTQSVIFDRAMSFCEGPGFSFCEGRALSFCEGDAEELDLHPIAKAAKRMRDSQRSTKQRAIGVYASHTTRKVPTSNIIKRGLPRAGAMHTASPDEHTISQVAEARKSVKLTEISTKDEKNFLKENTGGVALSRSSIPSRSFSSRVEHLKAKFKNKERSEVTQSSVEVTQEVVHQLLSSLNTNIKAAAGGNDSANSSKSCLVQSSGKDRTKSSEGNSKNKTNRNKRRKIDEKDGDEDDCSDTDSGRRRKSNEKPNPGDSPQAKRLKCPYYQRCPEECRLASCRGQGFTEMAKLKDHLKRVHIQPLRCTRCWEEVEIYDEHFRQDTICSKRPEPDDRRISPLKLRELRFNRAPFTKDQSVEEKWAILYRILFPDEKVVPSPYEQNEISTHMERLLIISLEEEIVKELGDVLGNVIDIIRQRLPGIVTRSRKKAQALSEESHNDDSSPPTTPTASSNSGAESLFDRPEVYPSSTTLDTDFGLPAISLDQQTQPNQVCDFVNWNESLDYIDYSAYEFGGMSHWDPENTWGPLLEFSNG